MSDCPPHHMNPHPNGAFCSKCGFTAEDIANLARADIDEESAIERAIDERDAEWQRRLGELHKGFDGDGCESGDPIDWSIAALNMRIVDVENRMFDEIAEWKTATGLTVGGDPDGVTPEHLSKHVEHLDTAVRHLAAFVEHRQGCYAKVGGRCSCGLAAILDLVAQLPKES